MTTEIPQEVKDKLKPLSEVTQDDAIEILKVEYAFFKTGHWKLTDESKDLGEPCKKLKSTGKAYIFWFFNDKIDIDLEGKDIPIQFDDTNLDAKYGCYIKAAQLGYYVPALSELLSQQERDELIKEVEKEQQDHYYTRCAWDTTIQQRNDLKNQLKAIAAIKRGLETSLEQLFKEMQRLKEQVEFYFRCYHSFKTQDSAKINELWQQFKQTHKL